MELAILPVTKNFDIMTVFEAKRLAENEIVKGNYSHSVTHWLIVGQGQVIVCSDMNVAERCGAGYYVFSIGFDCDRNPIARLH